MYVPCGRCADCRRKKHNDWFVRAWYEWLRYHKHGMILTASLTYNEKWLPHYVDKRDFTFKTMPDGSVDMIPDHVNFKCECFSMHDLSNFRKEFRTNIERRLKFCPDGIKFLICSEYGKKYRRPHYHVMIYLPFKIKIKQFEDVMSHSWHRGFFGRSKRFGYIVTGVRGVRYTTKYVCKDLTFFDEVIADYLDRDNLDPAEYEFRLKEFRECMPDHRQSINFGSNLVDRIKNMNDPAGFICTEKPINCPNSKGKMEHYDIPKYVKDKCCRTMNVSFSHLLGRPFFQDSPIGRQVKILRSFRGIEHDATEFYKMQDPLYINLSLNSYKFYKDRISHLSDNLSQLMQSLDLPKLAFYRRFLRFLPAETYPFKTVDGYFENCDEIVENYFNDLVLPPEIFDAVADLHPDAMDSFGVVKTDKNGKSKIFSSSIDPLNRSTPIEENKWLKKCDVIADLPIFEEYENACRYLDDFDMLTSFVKETAYYTKHANDEDVRACFSQYVLTESL